MTILTRKMIREMRLNFVKITKKQERELLKLLGSESAEDKICYSDQDIYEQTRIYLRDNPDQEPWEKEYLQKTTEWLEGLSKKEKKQNELSDF
jgi:hypothetical protein